MPTNSLNNWFALLGCMFGATLLVSLTQYEPFFWDTVQLGAMQGDWFYAQQFQTWLLPDQIDSGHIPAFGWYLAACWQVLGQQLWVSHWAMWPWIVLVAYQWWQLLGYTQTQWSRYWGMALLIASPVAMSQLSLISPDVVLLGAFLLALNSILTRQKVWLIFAVLILGLISMRGMLVAIALFCWQLYRSWPDGYGKRFGYSLETLLPYLPGGLIALFYLVYHYWMKGWVVVHADSPWAESFAIRTDLGLIRQFVIISWRLVDVGYLFVWLGLFIIAWRTKVWSKAITDSAVLLLILLLFLGIPMIMGDGLAQHRYLLPCFLTLSYLVWQMVTQFAPIKKLRIWVGLILLGLASGNLWVYPTGISQGWDATLLHKSFLFLDSNARKFLNEENITPSEIHTGFPLLAPQHYYWLNQDSSRLAQYQRSQLPDSQSYYVLYSNVVNEFEKSDLDALDSRCDTLYHARQLGVVYTLYDCH